jgi:hypothetical protein
MYLEIIQSITLILEYIAKINKLMSHNIAIHISNMGIRKLSSIFKPNQPKYGFLYP